MLYTQIYAQGSYILRTPLTIILPFNVALRTMEIIGMRISEQTVLKLVNFTSLHTVIDMQ